jgi:hypothetical protein
MLTAVLQMLVAVVTVAMAVAAAVVARRHDEVPAFRRGARILAIGFGVNGALILAQATLALVAVVRGPASSVWAWSVALNPPLNAARNVWLASTLALLAWHTWQPDRPGPPWWGWAMAAVVTGAAAVANAAWASVSYAMAARATGVALNLLLLIVVGIAWIGAARCRSLDGATWAAVGVYALLHGVAAVLLLLDWLVEVREATPRWLRPLRFVWSVSIQGAMLYLLARHAGRGRWGREGPLGGRPGDPAWRAVWPGVAPVDRINGPAK